MATTPRRPQKNTPTKKLEGEIRETIERYELIFKATNDILYELDLRNGKVTWNDALYTEYGYDHTEKADSFEWWTSHVHPDDALWLEHEINNWFDSDKNNWESEYRFRRADGTYVHVRDRGIVQRSSDKKPLRIIGSFLDITKQKQLDRAKDEFVSLVSHQLRTPLTAIRIHSEILTDGLLGELNDKQQDHLKYITAASIRLIKMVNDILDISKIELGHFYSNPLPVNINDFLRTQIDEVAPLAAQKGIHIHYAPNSKPDLVAVDTIIFAHIVHNLLTNAIRYGKEQSGQVDVSFHKDTNGFLLTVKDNGIGIPKSAHPHIFERFYRAKNTNIGEEQGTGLGLYLVKQMVDTTGCDIWFESNRNSGTTFYVRIPLEGMRAT